MVLVFWPLSIWAVSPVPRPPSPSPVNLPLLAWPLADDGIVGSSISATKYYKFRASSLFPALSSFLTHNKYKKCGRSYFDLHARISKVLTADFRFSPWRPRRYNTSLCVYAGDIKVSSVAFTINSCTFQTGADR
ncbi:uncharacterized protein F4817DRAFT_338000 [Daldinia loculata]|uniref:uncharacterized protein n=1 Tax=Daldinia loculata TaxID=103429 RepID=UPI0020C53557|nr:uncharacterized protein F4817DRAFT_338000 [Daldinia loculata]KAI1647261.1 hypothetical protein F4817DRAFT_338000 [Daldinia loculata]